MNIFGTDGIRDKANEGYITPENVTKLAIAATNYYKKKNMESANNRFTVVIGKDTRLSGYMLESALTAGFIAAGADVVLLGPIPTPGVAFLTRSLRADLGVVISASHNPYYDNGIKFNDYKGFKISKEDELNISKLFFGQSELADISHMGKAKRLDDAAGRYIEFVKSTFPKNFRLDGVKIVVDTANGAAYKVLPSILWELGADVISIGNNPNGVNINEKCGATNPETLQILVTKVQADIGIAVDGDADRLIVVDELGKIIDGDYIIAAVASEWRKEGKLKNNIIVATQMSNSGLIKFLNNLDIKVELSDVGDKHVVQKMIEFNANLGGEKNGHIILLDHAASGDGSIAALQILSYIIKHNIKTSNIAKLFKTIPQRLFNISFEKNIDDLIKNIKRQLKNPEKARIVIRKSGTEKLWRIMIETNEDLNNLVLIS